MGGRMYSWHTNERKKEGERGAGAKIATALRLLILFSLLSSCLLLTTSFYSSHPPTHPPTLFLHPPHSRRGSQGFTHLLPNRQKRGRNHIGHCMALRLRVRRLNVPHALLKDVRQPQELCGLGAWVG